ncbi:sulfotransferase 1c4 [Plakobranchus ocellatus]|uniref:Sulfotransferase 1c4 n=1 Tax=Plakobranchus ocellatus TaxID=259542 RepID=A0AAV4CQE0_9GAST|nr:sulfotransferase 1c4 [Plakobranchus ocellatus]
MSSQHDSSNGLDHNDNGSDVKSAEGPGYKSEVESSNPYHFPDFTLPTGIVYNSVPVMKFPVKDDPLTHIQNIRALSLREDDVIITAYPKCGTHWVAEILHMLTSGSTSYCSRTKEFTMLEFLNDLPSLEAFESPRLLNSHLYMAHLPEQILGKKVKVRDMCAAGQWDWPGEGHV